MDKAQPGVSPSTSALPIALRLVQALGLIGIAIVAGIFLGATLATTFHSAADHAYLAGALGISAILASLEKFIRQAPLLLRWIRTGVGEGLSAFASFMFLLVVTLAAALLSGSSPPVGPPVVTRSEAPIVLFVNAAAHDRLSKVGHESVFLIPFFHEAGGCSTSDDRFMKGAELDDSTKEFIGKLAKGLLHCARADRPVKLEVRGFASSKQFDEKCGPAESERLNKEIANARARAVVDEFAAAEDAARKADQSLSDQSLSGRVFVEPIIWADFDAMKTDQRWNDESAGKYSHERAVLTRRAELRVVDSGDCEVATPRPKPIAGATSDDPSSSRSEG